MFNNGGNGNNLPFDVGDTIVHMKDPFQEKHEVIDIVKCVDGNRFVIRSGNTGESMLLVISSVGLMGWKRFG